MSLYNYFVPFIRIALKVYFKKIYIINEHKMPLGKKTLYLLNHPTSFVDPILLAAQTKAYLHFLIRGDVFKKGVALRMLNSINGIPIFRATDSRNAKDKNNVTFDRIAEVLHRNGSVMIMPEGSTDKRRKLRPFKKGFAHMAMHYWKNYQQDDINIVPVSLSYSDPTRIRSIVHVKFDDPIPLSDYLKQYEDNQVKTINLMRDDAYKVMRKNIVHIEDDSDAPLVDQLIRLEHNSHKFSVLPIKDDSEALLQKEIKVTEHVNKLNEEGKALLSADVKKYKHALAKAKLSDAVVSRNKKWNPLSSLLLLIMLPFAFLGYVLNFLPVYSGKRIAHKLMKRDEFICSVKIGASIVFYQIYFLIIAIISFILLPWAYALAILGSIPLLAVVYIYFKGAWKRNMFSFKRSFANKAVLEQLSAQRAAIRN